MAENGPRGFLYEPRYEIEVVMLFGLMIPHLHDSFVVEAYNDAFPDCFASMNGQRIGIEFELLSGNFFEQHHDRDPRMKDCDMLICWKNNRRDRTLRKGDREFVKAGSKEIEILALHDELKNNNSLQRYIIRGRKPDLDATNKDNFFRQLKERATNQKFDWINEIFNWASAHPELEIRWGGGKRIYTMRVYVKKWDVDPVFIAGDGSINIQYIGNPGNYPWRLPEATQARLIEIFGHKKRTWPQAPLNSEKDLENVKLALQIMIEDSKSSDLTWHPGT
jgi:hypothetical protein